MRTNRGAEKQQAEVVVVGTGPGGATSAHILAEHGREVLLLEEGPDLPLESCPPFSVEEMVQKYRAGGLNPALGNAKLTFVEARTVGGGSEINSGLYHRTPAEILERWRDDFKVRESLESDLLPHFEYCEQALGVGTYPGLPPLASRKLEEGAKALGWRACEVPRWFKYDRAPGPDGCADGTRQSMTKTFLPRALQAGARLLPETYAQRLVRSTNGWKISAIRKGKLIEIRARTVFICGGALQTPLLLRRSGITKNVGNSLAMHPTAKVVARFNDQVNHEALGVAVHQVKEFSPRISFGCSVSSRPHLALALSDYPELGRKIGEQWRHMAVYYAMITGPHTGTIRPVFGLRDPLIRYSLSALDLQDLSTALRRLARLLLAAGATTVYPAMPDSRPITAEDELSAIPSELPASRSNLMTIHLFSSCPMGEDAARCATNSMGRVHGTNGLIVNDASLIPTAPGVNPQGTVMALARRNTLHFLGKL
ncbi:MAG: GMC family oxidoreductase [Verrucomicrobia bacterium]|nr:GMC family oxidoreductase [Verrucomicrobiota bacterium]